MSADPRGRSADEVADEQQRARRVHGVLLPGDVGAFVRDDAVMGDAAWPPAAAGWRCVREEVAVVLYPLEVDADGDPKPDTQYHAEVRRWNPETERYEHAEPLVVRDLTRMREPLRAAMRSASSTDVHAMDAFRAIRDELGA
jgi:hypothetical protein